MSCWIAMSVAGMTKGQTIGDQTPEGIVPEGIAIKGLAGAFWVKTFDSQDKAVTEVLKEISLGLEAALEARGQALWIGAGGSTPKPVYEGLKTLNLPWETITLSQVDERFVAIDHPQSNSLMIMTATKPVLEAGMAFISLIQDLSSPLVSAQKAEALLRQKSSSERPYWDVTLLGMGPDRHYASIFPNHPINELIYHTPDMIVPISEATGGAEPQLPRLSLSVSALNHTRKMILYITGQAKLEAIKASVAEPYANTSPIGAFLAQYPGPVDIIWAP
jgi:6-phosphogluconolactonase